MIYDNCEIPAENILGKPGDGFKIAMHTLDGGRVGVAAQALGIAQAALDAAANYAHQRYQFGKPIAKQQAIQFMIADMATEIEAAWLLVYKTAEILNTGDRRRASKYSAMAKLYASMCS
jgi:alkylation response protein AidB-like acyl-CoA dehydrogenase